MSLRANRRAVIALLLSLSMVLTGCASSAKRVDCTWKLEPINVPAK